MKIDRVVVMSIKKNEKEPGSSDFGPLVAPDFSNGHGLYPR